jgi:hypothetical protein
MWFAFFLMLSIFHWKLKVDLQLFGSGVSRFSLSWKGRCLLEAIVATATLNLYFEPGANTQPFT